MTRLAYIALFLVGLIAIVYALMSAGGGKPPENRLEAFATGEIEKLDFANAGNHGDVLERWRVICDTLCTSVPLLPSFVPSSV